MPGLGLKRVQRPGFPPHWYSEILATVRADIAPDVQPTTSVATVIVAAPDSKDTTRADFVVPAGSTSAQTVINQAINSLPATGGKVVLLEGTYIVDGSIVLPSNVHLKITRGATIKLKDNLTYNVNIVVNSDQTNGNTNIVISGPGTLDGGTQTAPEDPYLRGCFLKYVTNFRVTGLTVKNMHHQDGIAVWYCQKGLIDSNVCINNEWEGIRVGNSTEIAIIGNYCEGNADRDYAGIYVYYSTGPCLVANNICYANKADGINVENSPRCLVIGNICRNNTIYGISFWSQGGVVANNVCSTNSRSGIRLSSSSSDNLIIGNICEANSQGGNAYYDNIVIAGNYNNIQGNTCRAGALANKPCYGINIASGTGNNVQNNDLYSAGATANLYNAGTGTIIQNNRGYNPVGLLTAPTIPASGTALTNPFPFTVRVFVSGGTVSAIAINGTSTGLTSGEFVLAPGDSITLTYTAAPTWVWFGL